MAAVAQGTLKWIAEEYFGKVISYTFWTSRTKMLIRVYRSQWLALRDSTDAPLGLGVLSTGTRFAASLDPRLFASLF